MTRNAERQSRVHLVLLSVLFLFHVPIVLVALHLARPILGEWLLAGLLYGIPLELAAVTLTIIGVCVSQRIRQSRAVWTMAGIGLLALMYVLWTFTQIR